MRLTEPTIELWLCADVLRWLAGRDPLETEPGAERGWEIQSSERESSQASSISNFFVVLSRCVECWLRGLRHERLYVMLWRFDVAVCLSYS